MQVEDTPQEVLEIDLDGVVHDLAAEGGEQAAPIPNSSQCLAAAALRLLGDANSEIHRLAKREPSSEATEAINAIQRAKRLVSTRYLA